MKSENATRLTPCQLLADPEEILTGDGNGLQLKESVGRPARGPESVTPRNFNQRKFSFF